MKNVMFFLEGIYNGGTEIALYNLISKMDKNKYKIYIAYSDLEKSDSKMVGKILEHSEFHNINDEVEIDALIYTTSAINEIDIIEKSIKFKKAYFWFHYFWKDQEEFLIDIINNNRIDQVITVGKTTRDIILEWDCMKGKEDKIDVIHNVLDVEKINNKSNEFVDMDLAKDLNIITVARFAPVKGYGRVKMLTDILLEKGIDFKWFIIGKANGLEDEYGNKVKEMLSQYKDVVFLGEQENPYKYIKQCDYSTILSDRETWSLVITESKILGVPCLATDFPAVFEQIEHMQNGIIISRENSLEYSQKIDELIKNKEKLKENSKKFKYDINKILKQWDEKF